ncbi:cysteine--tRNA ligase, partial [Herbaspirillum sp. HC18]
LASRNFGQQPWHGRVIRLAMLGTHYRQPIDWTVDRLVQARATLMEFAAVLHGIPAADAPNPDVVAALSDDLNTPSAMSIVHGIAKSAARNPDVAAQLKATLQFMGVYQDEQKNDFAVGFAANSVDRERVEEL